MAAKDWAELGFDDEEKVCPNCGHVCGEETTCSHCGAILGQEADALDGFQEDEES